MFRVERVGEAGLLNTPVTILATEAMTIQEQRLRPHSVHVVRVEDWLLQISEGERFEVALPNSVQPKIGDTLALMTVMRERPFKSRWKKVSTF
ncbi:MAG: hypothetical protein M3Q08_10365 [Pseudomonadota bacterium]|nr:hypothetical protein [Pseudomonadota bacterium]